METVIPYLVEIVSCLAVTLIGVAGTWLTVKIGQSTKLKSISAAIEQVTSATQETVLDLQQRFVNDWKEAGGKLTDEQQLQLEKELLAITQAKLSAPVVGLLDSVGVDVKALIVSAGEAMIENIKNGAVVVTETAVEM